MRVPQGDHCMNKISRFVRLSQLRASEGHLGLWRQLGEMVVLRSFHGVGPAYYHKAGFWKRELSWQDKTSQLSSRAYRRRVNALNPASYRKLSQNKIPEKAILTLFNIPTPRFLGRLHAHIGLDASGSPLRCAADLEQLARDNGASRLVFKPLEGWGGKGVHVPRVEYGRVMTLSEPGRNEAMSVEDYCHRILGLDRNADWIVEEYFEQHPVLSAINPSSVNTIRIWVVEHASGDLQVLTAFLRIGRAGACVDNTSSGGIVAPVHLETGVLSAARNPRPQHDVYRQHPDHGASIEGVVLPGWKQTKELAKRALSAFPGMRFAGLDMAIGAAGPVVLELNVSPDRGGVAYTNCPSARLLTVK